MWRRDGRRTDDWRTQVGNQAYLALKAGQQQLIMYGHEAVSVLAKTLWEGGRAPERRVGGGGNNK